ncbi:MAG: hypothetical protein RTU92_02610 [Candidatus Thorarchaeota archaeon]
MVGSKRRILGMGLNYNNGKITAEKLKGHRAIDARNAETFAQFKHGGKYGNRKPKFNPNSEELKAYMAEYLKNGGKVTKLEPSGVGKPQTNTIKSRGATARAYARR